MQKESTGGRGRAGGGACVRRSSLELRRRGVAAAYVEHGAYEVADHVVEEAAAAHAIDEQIAVRGTLFMLCRSPRWFGQAFFCGLLRLLRLLYFGFSVAGGLVGICRGKAQKVMCADEEAVRRH